MINFVPRPGDAASPRDPDANLSMADPPTHDVTELLAAWGGGDEAALERLVPLVHAELHRLARRYMGREHAGHTLQTSALVNEAYVRLINWKDARFENRAHFFGVSAQLMRRILVDFARSRPRVVREGTAGGAGGAAAAAVVAARRVALDEALLVVSDERETDLIALDEALEELAKLDARKSKIVELRFFGGLSVEETSEFLKISPATVMREWAKAKAWLYRELSAGEAEGGGDAG